MIAPRHRGRRLLPLAGILLTACPRVVPPPAPEVAAALAPAPSSEAPVPPLRTCGGPTPPDGPKTVHDVDWCNRTYLWLGTIEREVVGGEFDEELWITPRRGKTSTSNYWWRIDDVAYGDLDGDGEEEAAVVIEEYEWYSPDFEVEHLVDIRVFSLRQGAVVQIASTALNGAPEGTLADFPVDAIRDGELTRTWPWRGAAPCVDRWRLHEGSLERVTPRCT